MDILTNPDRVTLTKKGTFWGKSTTNFAAYILLFEKLDLSLSQPQFHATKKKKKTNDKVGNKTTNKEGKKDKERAREAKNRNSFAKKRRMREKQKSCLITSG